MRFPSVPLLFASPPPPPSQRLSLFFYFFVYLSGFETGLRIMESHATGSYIPVVFSDGEREIDIGNVAVQPSMQFKAFQSIISQKIGISPHQFTIYFQKSSSPPSLNNYRKIPVTNKFNFASTVADQNCYFRAVLKRSRRVRRRRHPKHSFEEDDDDGYSIAEEINPPENFLSLRRNPYSPFSDPAVFPYHDQNSLPLENWYPRSDYLDYVNRIKFLETEKEKYLYLTSSNSNPNSFSDFDICSTMDESFGIVRASEDGASSSSVGERDRVFCEVCANARMDREDQAVLFHCCKYDDVTVGFRPVAGPIARPPPKSSG
ncbi:hypothetical protein Nepgr_024991 [Nepenthes gracilis]|uniref:DUF7138 domain-containing protein n=1 Tax=Nepenthes gracilis TaxID=150966 RepID=A0AAD3T3X4_NEPGR|nr:hypothetical protein Nepgr_024991 [Nepenthes gracilis]